MKLRDKKCRPFGPQTFQGCRNHALTGVAIECRPFGACTVISSKRFLKFLLSRSRGDAPGYFISRFQRDDFSPSKATQP
jgi:hypothetical protein